MATLTIRIPDDKHNRLKALAQHRHISVNKLMEEFSTQAIAEFDSEMRFRAFADRGDIEQALGLLEKIDANFSSSSD
jgi:predicted transcriptional regulator